MMIAVMAAAMAYCTAYAIKLAQDGRWRTTVPFGLMVLSVFGLWVYGMFVL
jgi:NO-binding membrane sensor protein with MHYT domain